MARYSLARYILTIQLPNDLDAAFISAFGQSLSIGGEGSMVGSIKLSLSKDLWSTEGDATGGYTHNQSLDRTGTCTIDIKQVADSIAKFIRLCNCFYKSSITASTGLYLELKDNEGNIVATCNDCYITKIADQEFTDTAGDQTWTFTCGKITIA